MAWKDKIPVSSQKERYKPETTNDIPLMIWKFDMVHYPSPKGWQIENWRLGALDRGIEPHL
jgi:hypothetical protein